MGGLTGFFEAVLISTDNVIRGRSLEGLGHINVFCGRNNSGKSKVLSKIFECPSGISAATLTSNEQLVEGIVGNIPTRNQSLPVLTELVNQRSYWYTSDGPQFADSIRQAVDRQQGRFLASKSEIEKIWGDLFLTGMGDRRMIPSPRTVDVQEAYLGQNVTESGGHLLIGLLHAKNSGSLPGSFPERLTLIRDAFFDITDGFQFDVSLRPHAGANAVFLEITPPYGMPTIGARDAGVGLRDLLVLLYWITEPSIKVLFIEEPESHLHPDMQRRLLAHMGQYREKQFFLSTHSSVFLDPRFVDRVFHVKYDGRVSVSDETCKAALLQDLGYSIVDNLAPDCVVLTEGPSDWPVISAFLEKRGLVPKYDIRQWILGGDAMDQLDLEAWSSQSNLVAVIDSDPKSAQIRARFEANCQRLGITCKKLSRRAIENYFTPEAIKVAMGNIEGRWSQLSKIDPDQSVAEQVGCNLKKWNGAIGKAMRWGDIEHTDLGTLILHIEQLVTSASHQAV